MRSGAECFRALCARSQALGASGAEVIPVRAVVTDPVFRDVCKQNTCGAYGKCWTCPPEVGEIDDLIASLAAYDHCLLFQTIGALEDSFDFEGMIDAKKRHNEVTQAMRKLIDEFDLKEPLLLGAGGCGVCESCAKRTGEPCRFPDLAISSLEAYGVYVSKTVEHTNMKYINGQNTVTYFGALFFHLA